MSNISANTAVAVDELLNNIIVPDCIEVLDELFECWLTHEQTDGQTGREREVRFTNYKDLRKFLSNINR